MQKFLIGIWQRSLPVSFFPGTDRPGHLTQRPAGCAFARLLAEVPHIDLTHCPPGRAFAHLLTHVPEMLLHCGHLRDSVSSSDSSAPKQQAFTKCLGTTEYGSSEHIAHLSMD